MFRSGQPSALRVFLTSNVGGGLAALASVLLVVLVVLAMRGKPADTRQPGSVSQGFWKGLLLI